MKTTFISLIALGVAAAMAGPADRALADEPMVLTDAQLDQVTAGSNKLFVGNLSWDTDDGRLQIEVVGPHPAELHARRTGPISDDSAAANTPFVGEILPVPGLDGDR
jgi:hypothetical protein